MLTITYPLDMLRARANQQPGTMKRELCNVPLLPGSVPGHTLRGIQTEIPYRDESPEHENDRIDARNHPDPIAGVIIGRSQAMRAVLKEVQIVARTNANVLILGETGTGKELIARTLHNLSARREHPLLKVNCAAIPTTLLESELFGYERGAFTGAYARKAGRFELAHRGTLFLDEVGDIPLELQPKLLRVLQEKEFERLGGTQTHQVNVRMVAATSQDLFKMVAERQFRSDLYYRLNVFPIRIPALRERPEDIPLLVQHFVNLYSGEMNKRIETTPPETMLALQRHHWPGNVRELQNIIERAVILSPGSVLKLPTVKHDQTRRLVVRVSVSGAAQTKTLEECEREHIQQVLTDTHWVVGGRNGAAARLGVKRTTLIAKMGKLGIACKSKFLLRAPKSILRGESNVENQVFA
jgi:formate hydrogenlyase transcriptional activator